MIVITAFSISIIYLFLTCWVFTAARALLQLQQVGAALQLQYMGFSCCRAHALGLAGPREQAQELWRLGLVAPRHVGVFLDRGSNPRLLHWQGDSLPRSHQGSHIWFLTGYFMWFLAQTYKSLNNLCLGQPNFTCMNTPHLQPLNHLYLFLRPWLEADATSKLWQILHACFSQAASLTSQGAYMGMSYLKGA